MRLNFAGVPDENIREGIRRIGRIMGGEKGLLGTLTGSQPAASFHAGGAPATGSSQPAPEQADAGREDTSPLADIVALPRRDADDPARQARRRRDR